MIGKEHGMIFNSLKTEAFINDFYDDLLDAYNNQYLDQDFVDRLRAKDEYYSDPHSVWTTEIWDYFDERSEEQYYNHLESLNG